MSKQSSNSQALNVSNVIVSQVSKQEETQNKRTEKNKNTIKNNFLNNNYIKMSGTQSNPQALNAQAFNTLENLKQKLHKLKIEKSENKKDLEIYEFNLEDAQDEQIRINDDIKETEDKIHLQRLKIIKDKKQNEIKELKNTLEELKSTALKFRKCYNITRNIQIKEIIREIKELETERDEITHKYNELENKLNTETETESETESETISEPETIESNETKDIEIKDYESESTTESETEPESTTESETEPESTTESEPENKTDCLLDLNKEDDINKLRLHLYNYSFYGFNVPTISSKYGFDIFEFKESLIKYIDEDNETLKYLLEIIELYNNYQFTKNQQEKYKEYKIRYKFIYDKLNDYKILMNDSNNYINDIMALIYIMIEEPPHIEDRNELIKLIYTCFHYHLTKCEDLTDQESEPDSEPETEEEEEEDEDKKIYLGIHYKRHKHNIIEYFEENFNYTNDDFNDVDKLIKLCLYVQRMTGEDTDEIDKIKLLNDCFNDEQKRNDDADPSNGWRIYRLYCAIKPYINNDDTKQDIKIFRKHIKEDYDLKISKSPNNCYNIYTLYYFLKKSYDGLENYEKKNISKIIFYYTIYNIISAYDFEEDPPRYPKFDTSYKYNLDVRGDVETLIYYMNIKNNDIINKIDYDRYDGIDELLDDIEDIINNLIKNDLEENTQHIEDKYIILNELIKNRKHKKEDINILKKYDDKILHKFNDYGIYKEKHEKQLYKFLNMIDAIESGKIENNLIALVNIYKFYMCPEEITNEDKHILDDYIDVLLYIYGEHLNNLKDNNYFHNPDYNE
jgi:hypothetical protein